MKKKKRSLLLAFFVCALIFVSGCSGAATAPDDLLWVNGTYALFAKSNGWDIYMFGGAKSSDAAQSSRSSSLSVEFGVESREDCDVLVDVFLRGHHNAELLGDMQYYEIIDMTPDIFEEALKTVEKPEDVAFFRNIYEAYERYGDNAIMAWDWSRAARVLAAGYLAGYYTYDEATGEALEIGRQIQAAYESWDAFYDSYLHGYVYWSRDDINDPESGYARNLLVLEELKGEEAGPLQMDWNMDLSGK